MSSYKEQVEVEKQKIEMFQKQIDKCKRRISSLESLMEDSGDELDTLASHMITATAPIEASSSSARLHETKEIPNSENESVRTPKKRLGEKTIKLLKEIGKEGKELRELVSFAKENNLGLDDQNIRNMAMIYRKQYGYIENPRKGFYCLSDAGQKAVAAL